MAYLRGIVGAAGGAVPVAVVLGLCGFMSLEASTRDLVFAEGEWRLAAMAMFALAVVAILLGLARAVVFVRARRRDGTCGADRLGWPRIETVGLLVIGLTYVALVAFVFGGGDPCEDMPSGSDRTACAMGHGAFYLLLVAGGFIVWVICSLGLAVVWIARTAVDLRTRLRAPGVAVSPTRRSPGETARRGH